MVGLGHLPEGSALKFSVAGGVSADGSVVAGTSFSGATYEAFVWSKGSGMVGLGDLKGNRPSVYQSQALAISGDGKTVVGFGDTNVSQEAFIWDSANGMRALEVVLSNIGVDLTGWTLDRATGVSFDGRAIAGYGTYNSVPAAFLAYLEPSLTLSKSTVAGCQSVTGKVQARESRSGRRPCRPISDTLRLSHDARHRDGAGRCDDKDIYHQDDAGHDAPERDNNGEHWRHCP